MRGKDENRSIIILISRITPAYAGKSGVSYYKSEKKQDHPCVCGEKFKRVNMPLFGSGSPLRMRGKATSSIFAVPPSRITPAYAGKRHKRACVLYKCWDHPCVCGEKAFGDSMPDGHKGSPLRMRGKERLLGHLRDSDRITPAYAGKSFTHSVPPLLFWDHPCVCGEKVDSFQHICIGTGSPLRMRGKAISGCSDLLNCRITPAYAGKS